MYYNTHTPQHNDQHHHSHSQKYDSVVYHNSLFLKKLSHGPDKEHNVSWRERLGHFLESKPENIVILSLIILDLLIICAQLFIIDQYEKCNPPTPSPTDSPTHSPTHLPYNYYYTQTSSSEVSHKIEVASEVLDIASLVILGVLALEMVLLLIAFDVKFFKQPLYILDTVVIGITLYIEVRQWIKEHEGSEDSSKEHGGGSTVEGIGNFVIFFRLWRIVRIVHGVAVSVQEQSEEKIKMLEAEVHKLEEEKQKLSTKFDYIKKRYKKLVDAHKEHEHEVTPTQQRSRNRLRIDDVYEATPAQNSPPRNGSQSFSPSPFKSPGAPNMLSHHIISINDDDVIKNKQGVGGGGGVGEGDVDVVDEDIVDLSSLSSRSCAQDDVDVNEDVVVDDEDSDEDREEEKKKGGVESVKDVVVVPNTTVPNTNVLSGAIVGGEEESVEEDEHEQRRPLLSSPPSSTLSSSPSSSSTPSSSSSASTHEKKANNPPPYNTFNTHT